ncbi:MAG: NAD-dependent epimerase/dehydratase family protein, partial [Bacteriovoracaceae bacterium]
MKILVTGGGGFLGTYIIRELLKNPSYMVTNFSRHSYVHLEDIGVPTIKGDLRVVDDVKRALDFGFDAIFHVAALAGVWGKYEDYYSINFEGTQNLINLAKERGVKKFVYTSTPSVVFGEGDLMGADESTPYAEKHFTYYAETKT